MDAHKDTATAVRPAREIIESHEFRRLVSKRWSVSIILTALLFVLYYGYILLIGYNKPLLATKIGDAVTLGIPMGVGVIVLSWALTVVYVVWANRSYDPEVKKLRDQVK